MTAGPGAGPSAIWWVRRDLRLSDNPALSRAAAGGLPVVPVFVADDSLAAPRPAAAVRTAFLLSGLRALDTDLRRHGSRLVVRSGDPLRCLADVAREVGARLVVVEEDPSPEARDRDAAVAAVLPLQTVPGVAVHPLGAVRKADGGSYVVFGPFHRAWRALGLPRPSDLPAVPDRWAAVGAVHGEPLPEGPSLPPDVPFAPGEAEARRRLEAFVSGPGEPAIYRYASERDRPDLDGTSHLSPYLRFGMLAAGRAVAAAGEALRGAATAEQRRGVEAWLAELAWRDFYLGVLADHPFVLGESFRADLRGMAWAHDPEALDAWREGRTGYPFVDAAMRQLQLTGWMHNRARMVVASFLTKHLLTDWRQGERHFMRHLVDGDPAANNGGWQWAAGTGTDAAPYFRVFNPTTQARRHDPEGAYIRRWLPELRPVPQAHVHAPWEMEDSTARACGCIIGDHYPAPVVEHGWARERAIATYRSARLRVTRA